MKKKVLLHLFFLIIISPIVFGQVQVDTVDLFESGIERILIEKNTVPGTVTGVPSNSINYRVFVDMLPNHRLVAFGGYNDPRFMTILSSSSTGFFNFTTIGPIRTGDMISSALVNVFPEIAYDSYFTDGRIGGSGEIGVLKSIDISGSVIASDHGSTVNPYSVVYGNLVTNPDLLGVNPGPSATDVEDFGIVAPAGSVGYDSANSNIIFIAQLTTDGDLTLELNFDLLDAYHGNNLYVSNVQYTSIQPEPPVVSIINPVDSAEINQGTLLTIQADAMDPDGIIDSVEFLINGIKIGTDYLEPYEIEWSATIPSNYNLIVKATDNEGLIGTDTVSFNVLTENIAPEITISSPEENGCLVINQPLTISAEASDIDGTVISVRFSIDGINLSTITAEPFEMIWTPDATGLYGITALATDDFGDTDVATVNVNVQDECMDAVGEISSGFSISIYPNPSDLDCLILMSGLKSDKIVICNLYDLYGNLLIAEDKMPNSGDVLFSFNLSVFNSGIYLVKLTYDNKIITRMITKN